MKKYKIKIRKLYFYNKKQAKNYNFYLKFISNFQSMRYEMEVKKLREDTVNDNCYLNPPAHSSNYREPCPIGTIWYHRNLSKWDLSKLGYQIGLKKNAY